MERADEECGGDPPCWAHLFDDDATPPDSVEMDRERGTAKIGGSSADGATWVLDLAEVARSSTARGPAETLRSNDLDVNVLVFGVGEGVAEHANTDVDVLIVGIAGEGIVAVDGQSHALRRGRAVLVPKGTRRGTRATTEGFAYLTCHRRRGGLRPTTRTTR
jgi:quercetin dioxygenase-like cupin family protein